MVHGYLVDPLGYLLKQGPLSITTAFRMKLHDKLAAPASNLRSSMLTRPHKGTGDGETGIESGIGDVQKQRQTDVSRWEVKQRFMLGQDPKVPSTVVIRRSLVKFAGMFSGKNPNAKWLWLREEE